MVPGFRVDRMLGQGGHGQVWLARDLSCGADVALKLASGPGPEADQAWEREVALLRRIDHPHVVRLRRVVAVGGGGRALVLELAPAGSLAALVHRRGRLEQPEVTTVLVPLARALVHLHERGLVHGDISPGNVLFGADGRPMLSDLGAARVLGLTEHGSWAAPGFHDPNAGSGGDPAGDVWSLGAVGWYALTGSPPGGAPRADPPGGSEELLGLLHDCLDPSPSTRPGPAEVATRAWAAIPPAPIRLLHPPQEPPMAAGSLAVTRRVRLDAAREEAVQAASRRRRLRGNRFAWALAAGLAAVAVLCTVVIRAGGSGPQAPEAAAGAPAGGMVAAVQALGRTRADALAERSLSRLREVDEPRSPAMAADVGLIGRLTARGLRLEGVAFQVSRVRRIDGAGATVTVSAAVATTAHRQVSADGERIAVPAAPARVVRLTLVRARDSPHGWLVRSVA